VKKELGKLYDRFTPDERFGLVIEALAREDEEEAKRLVDACPRLTYRMLDLAYADRFKASLTVTIGFCLDLAPFLIVLGKVEDIREVLLSILNLCENVAKLAYLEGSEAGFEFACAVASKTAPPPRWEKRNKENPEVEEGLQKITARFDKYKEDFVSPLEELKRRITREALTLWEAFAGFCNEELLIAPEKLVKVWFEPILPEIEKLKNLQDQPEVDPEELKEYQAALKQAWSGLVRSI